jgi:hypothetical protein
MMNGAGIRHAAADGERAQPFGMLPPMVNGVARESVNRRRGPATDRKL